MRKFKVKDYHRQRGLCYNVQCPSKFTAEVAGKSDLEQIIGKVIKKIKDADVPCGHQIFYDDAKIPYNNQEIDKKNKVVAFVLLQETPLVGGMSWKEGIYGLKLDGKKLKGELIKYNSGSHANDGFGKININPGSRLMVDKIKDGVLHYTYKTSDGSHKKRYDLRNL